MNTVGDLLDQAEARLKASDRVEHPHPGKERYDAEELLAFVLGAEIGHLDLDLTPADPVVRRYRRLLARRLTGEPNAYITGQTSFAGLTLHVGRGAFIPRESSEFMAHQALQRLRSRRAPAHVDLATGVGPVALTVARALPSARVFGTDISATPVAMARQNARALGLANASFVRGDLFGPLPSSLLGAVDVITVHPPYVGTREMKSLPAEIVGFEPRESLTDGSPLGDRILGRVASEAPRWLRAGGWLLVEVSPDRAREVSTTLRRAGYGDVRSTKGGPKVTRVVVGRNRRPSA